MHKLFEARFTLISSIALALLMVVILLTPNSGTRLKQDRSIASQAGLNHEIIKKVAPMPTTTWETDKATLLSRRQEAHRAQDTAHAEQISRQATISAAKSLQDIGPHPLREQLKRDIITNFLHDFDGIRIATEVLTNIDATIATYGDNQAAVRVLALAAIEVASRDNPAVVIPILLNVAQYLSQRTTWPKGFEFDYRDLLYTYFDNNRFTTLESNTEQFLRDTGHNQQIAPLLRRFTLQRFDGHVSDERMYGLLRKIGGL